jgi:CPA1 family monovalent cation:H+ antiporter
MFDTALVLLILAGLLVIVAISQPLAIALKLPQSVVLAAFGIGIGALPAITAQMGLPVPIATAADLFAKLPLNSAIFIYVFLPLLVFEAGVAADVKRTIEDAAPILFLAVVATLITAAVIGLALWPFAQVPLVVCLLLGSIVATTDPAAVIAVFRDVGAPRRLSWLVEGEALLNDAAAIALFILLLGFIEAGRQPSAIVGLGEFILLFLSELWEQIAFWARSLIFVSASILVPRLLTDIGLHDVLLLGVLIAAAFAARAFALFGLLPPLERLGFTQRIDFNYKFAIIWGGLRGALTLVLALAVTEHAALPPYVQRFVAVLATGFVLFTLFVNGVTLRLAIRLLRLDRLSARDEALRDHIQALSLAEARDAAREIAHTHDLSQTVVDRVIAPYQAKLDGAQSNQDAVVGNMTEADQLAIALASLANQERVSIIDMLRERVVSPGAAHTILGNAERLAEAARTEGLPGYERASDATLNHPLGFRMAVILYSRLGIVAPLADRLSERLEILLVMRIALGRLAVFNFVQITKLFGKQIAATTHETVSRRRQAIENALNALRQHYPGYLTELEVRFLAQSTLHHEMSRYQNLFDEGLISRELYEDLKRTTLGAESSARRPHFDIGLDTHKLVRHLDLLASLDENQLDIVCGLLRPRFAIPNERIIRRGDPGDGVYFIASGTVEVVLPDRRIQIGSGAFFGEMALLSGRVRQADVIALTYCQLLVLRRSEFEQFMRENPDAKAAIVRVAKARQLTNLSNGVSTT